MKRFNCLLLFISLLFFVSPKYAYYNKMERKRLFTVSLLIILYFPIMMSQTLKNGQFSYDNVYLSLYSENNFNVFSDFLETDDLYAHITWNEGKFSLQDSILRCENPENNISLKFKILDANRLKLIYCSGKVINEKKYNDVTPLDSFVSKTTIKNVNECQDFVIFLRYSIFNAKDQTLYRLRWENGKIKRINDLKSFKPVQNIDSLLNTFKL